MRLDEPVTIFCGQCSLWLRVEVPAPADPRLADRLARRVKRTVVTCCPFCGSFAIAGAAGAVPKGCERIAPGNYASAPAGVVPHTTD